MSRVIALVVVYLSLCGASFAGQAKYRVDLVDLASVGIDRLESLMEEEHALASANVLLAAAKHAEAQAKGGVKTAKRVVDAEEADQKAAESELKAAKKNQDADRTRVAEVLVANTKSDLQTARLLVRWKEQEARARRADVARAKAAIDVKTAELELAKAKLILEAEVPAAEKYDIGAYSERLNQRVGESNKATSRAEREDDKALALKAEWIKLAGTEIE